MQKMDVKSIKKQDIKFVIENFSVIYHQKITY